MAENSHKKLQIKCKELLIIQIKELVQWYV